MMRAPTIRSRSAAGPRQPSTRECAAVSAFGAAAKWWGRASRSAAPRWSAPRWLAPGLLGLLAACGGAPSGDSNAGVVGSNGSSRDERANASNAPTEADRLTALRDDARVPGFERVTAPRPFDFPRDHGPHPEFRHEWWYFTGHLDSSTGEPFGFELTFFRFGLKPPAAVELPANASAWRANQIYMAHFAVTDIGQEKFHVAERFARDALGLAGASADPLSVSLGDWSLRAQPMSSVGARPGGAQPLGAQPAGTPPGIAQSASSQATGAQPGGTQPAGSQSTWHLVAADGSYKLDLQMNPHTPMMLNGDAGFSRKSSAEGAASYYYSIPRMAARGQLTRDGKALDVQGNVWLDREWGSGALSSDQQGWDWFALQLEDGSALMFYALRTRDSKRDPHSAGTWLAPDGTMRALANDDVSIDVKGEWTSPRGVRYPAKWQLRVRSLNLDVEIDPRLPDQELNTSTRYWEGACLVTGTREGRRITGKAYVELVGYSPGGAG